MDEATYHIKIKKEYASAVLEGLQQADAIEIIEDPIPAWQQKESLKRLKAMQEDPANTISHEDFIQALDIEH